MPGLIPISKVVVASTSTTSGTITNISGLTTTVTLTTSAHIMAFMSLESYNDGNNRIGYFAISINGVDSPIFYQQAGRNNRFNVGVTYRTVTALPAGTYTIAGRYYRSASTQYIVNATLVAIGLQDANGGTIESIYSTVAGPLTTTATSPTDITGLTERFQAPVFRRGVKIL